MNHEQAFQAFLAGFHAGNLPDETDHSSLERENAELRARESRIVREADRQIALLETVVKTVQQERNDMRALVTELMTALELARQFIQYDDEHDAVLDAQIVIDAALARARELSVLLAKEETGGRPK